MENSKTQCPAAFKAGAGEKAKNLFGHLARVINLFKKNQGGFGLESKGEDNLAILLLAQLAISSALDLPLPNISIS